jgi:hypothetical protein
MRYLHTMLRASSVVEGPPEKGSITCGDLEERNCFIVRGTRDFSHLKSETAANAFDFRNMIGREIFF